MQRERDQDSRGKWLAWLIIGIPLVILLWLIDWTPYGTPSTTRSTSEPRETTRSEPAERAYRMGQVLEDKTYSNYVECDYVATVAAQELMDKGADVDLEKNPSAEQTVYTARYGGATVRFSCDGGRYRSQIMDTP
jgi:hypothetical protein